jgi:VWFA-related protein
MRHHVGFRAFVVAALTSLGLSDDGRLVAQDRQSPTFRVSTQLIQLDVVVTDSSGKPVGSLAAEDFEIKQDGKPLPVRFAEYVEPSSSRVTSRAALPQGSQEGSQLGSQPRSPERSESLESPESRERSEARFAGRRIVVVVDDSYMNFDSVVRSKEALASLVAESLRAGDLLSITGTNDRADQPLVFTSDPEELVRQIGRVQWSAIKHQRMHDRAFMQSACTEQELSDDLQTSSFKHGTFGVLASVLEQMRALPGRKALLLVADGVQTCLEHRDATWERLRRLADSANRSAVVIYGMQTLPFSSGVKMPEQRATEADIRGSAIQPRPFVNVVSEYMRSLSVRTGGFARRTNDIREQLDRVLTDFRGYYLLAYEPPPDTFQPGKPKFRKVSVRVRNEKLNVRTRPGFYSVDDERLFAH